MQKDNAQPANSVEKIGIKELKEATRFLIKFVNVGDRALEDGFQGSDLIDFISLYPEAAIAFAGSSEIPREIGDMDAQEAEEYKAIFLELELNNEAAEEIAEVCLQEVINLQQSVKRVIAVIHKHRDQEEEVA